MSILNSLIIERNYIAISILLEYGESCNKVYNGCRSALETAIVYCDLKMVKFIYSYCGNMTTVDEIYSNYDNYQYLITYERLLKLTEARQFIYPSYLELIASYYVPVCSISY